MSQGESRMLFTRLRGQLSSGYGNDDVPRVFQGVQSRITHPVTFAKSLDQVLSAPPRNANPRLGEYLKAIEALAKFGSYGRVALTDPLFPPNSGNVPFCKTN